MCVTNCVRKQCPKHMGVSRVCKYVVHVKLGSCVRNTVYITSNPPGDGNFNLAHN